MTDIAEIGFKADTGDLDKVPRKLGAMTDASKRAEDASDKLAKRIQDLGSKFDPANTKLGRLIGTVKTAGIAFLAAFGAKAYANIADGWSDISARVGLATGDIENGAEAMDRLSDMARRTYSSLSSTAEGFTGVAVSMRELGYDTNQTLDYVEAINNALVVSGAKGERAESVMTALSKAMALGKLSGINLQTVLASGGRVAEALASGMGTTVNKLRSLGAQGKITGKDIYLALTSQLEKLREEADSMPATIGDGLVLIGNSVLQLVGKFDKLTGISANVSLAFVKVADGLKFVADNIDKIAAVAMEGATALAIMFSPIIVGAIWSMVTATIALSIAMGNRLVTAIISAYETLYLLALYNPFIAIFTAITTVIALIYIFRDEISQILGFDIVAVTKTGVNTIIGYFVGGYNSIIAVWKMLPAVIGDYVISSANNSIKITKGMVNSAIEAINSLIAKIPSWLGGGENAIEFRLDVDTDVFDNKFAGSMKDAGAIISDEMTKALKTDYVDKFSKKLDEVTKKTVALGTPGPDVDEKRQAKFDEIVNGAERSIAAMKAEGQALGLNFEASARLRNETDLLNQAKQKGLILTPKETQQLRDLAAQMAKTETATENLKFMKEAANDNAAVLASLKIEADTLGMNAEAAMAYRIEQEKLNDAKAKGLVLSPDEVAQLKELAAGQARATIEVRKAVDAFEFLKSTSRGFFDDLKEGLANGESLWKSFGDAALNVLNKIADKLADKAFDALFNSSMSAGSSGGGFLGALGSMLFANGGSFDSNGLSSFANGGAFTNDVVSKRTMFSFANGTALGEMGEAGPEAIMPLKRGPDGSLGVQMHGARGASNDNGQPVQIVYAPVYHIAQGADPAAIAELKKAQADDRKQFQNKVGEAIVQLRRRNVKI